MDVSPIAHMFERLENCHKLSQLAPNSRSNTLAAGRKAFAGMRSDPGKEPGRVVRVCAVRPGCQIASIVDPTISAVDRLQNSNVSGVGSHGSRVALAEPFHPTLVGSADQSAALADERVRLCAASSNASGWA